MDHTVEILKKSALQRLNTGKIQGNDVSEFLTVNGRHYKPSHPRQGDLVPEDMDEHELMYAQQALHAELLKNHLSPQLKLSLRPLSDR